MGYPYPKPKTLNPTPYIFAYVLFLGAIPDPREDPKSRSLNGGSYTVPLVVWGPKLGDLLSRSFWDIDFSPRKSVVFVQLEPQGILTVLRVTFKGSYKGSIGFWGFRV